MFTSLEAIMLELRQTSSSDELSKGLIIYSMVDIIDFTSASSFFIGDLLSSFVTCTSEAKPSTALSVTVHCDNRDAFLDRLTISNQYAGRYLA